ncbi:hypothetical protein [Saccharopolyspora sp. NPDC049426]|uniref:hypothetical protein n=1 Tax=Saccharopolyspora sp. NPDC049426 TaxID=3155652 RepID=UPI0034274D7F
MHLLGRDLARLFRQVDGSGGIREHLDGEAERFGGRGFTHVASGTVSVMMAMPLPRLKFQPIRAGRVSRPTESSGEAAMIPALS